MKKLTLCASVVLLGLTTSCKTMRTFTFLQVFETKPVSEKSDIKNVDGGMLYENADCAIFYKLWDEGGNAGFEIHNKTDKMIYVDLSKSFFVKNGIAYNYFLNREWGNASSSSVQSSNSVAVTTTNTSSYYSAGTGSVSLKFKDPAVTNTTTSTGYASTSTSTKSQMRKEEKIVAVPPHKSKLITEYSISNSLVVDCAMEQYPAEKSKKLTYTKDNSPLKFSNYITYNKGEGTAETVIENEFYVSSVINYAEPTITEYVERAETCENLKHPDAVTTTYVSDYYKVYDKYLKPNTVNTPTAFYITYDVKCYKVIYSTKTYYWNSIRGGYTTYPSYY